MFDSIGDLLVPVAFLCVALLLGYMSIAWRRIRSGGCPFGFDRAACEMITVPDKPQAPAMHAPLRIGDPANRAFLQDLQGNILNGHGRDYAIHISVELKPDCSTSARRFLCYFAENYLSSAFEQFESGRQFRLSGLDAGVFGHLAISASGYRALGFSNEELPRGLNPRRRPDGKGYAEVFARGMKARTAELQDPSSSDWEPAYQSPVDLLLILAADDPAQLEKVEADLTEKLSEIAQCLHLQKGQVLKKQLDPSDPTSLVNVEHFGYVDGRSQPLMTVEQIEKEKAAGSDKWDATAPLNLVLAPDPLGISGFSCGSFMVYRKLEQNLSGFASSLEMLASELGVSVEHAAALLMGRFRDGTPLASYGQGGRLDLDNNFNFADDPRGLKCPLQAHIRKSNPRLSTVSGRGPSPQNELRHRIVRRGIPYGGDLLSGLAASELPEKGRGLLFICYQADIFEQFEFIQRTWSNFKNFPQAQSGLDPVIGQGERSEQLWPQAWGKGPLCPAKSIAQNVRLLGGEYFFSPSISFFKRLEAETGGV